MRKLFIIGAFIFVLTGYALPKSLTLSTLSWIDYSVDFNDDFDITGDGSFYIKRQYVKLSGSLNDKFDAKLTLDFAKPALTNDKYFKEVYGRFKFADALQLTVGLQKVEFGLHPYWPTPMPVTSHPNKIKVIASTDLGISLGGKLAGGVFEYDIQLMNGEGYGYWYSRDNVCFAGIANAILNYTEGGRVGVSYKYADADADFDMAFDLFLYHELDFASIMLEYVGEVTNTDVKDYFSAFLSVKAGDYVDVLGRCDVESEAETDVYVGANIHPFTGVALKPLVGLTIGDQIDFSLYTELEIKLGYTWSDEE